MIKATFVGLKKIQAPRSVASKRGRKVADILGKASEQAAAS
jgi:small subunit ribosomal protein S5